MCVRACVCVLLRGASSERKHLLRVAEVQLQRFCTSMGLLCLCVHFE